MEIEEIKKHIDDQLIKDLTSITNVYGIDRWEQEQKIFDTFLHRKNLLEVKGSDLGKMRDEVIEYVICEIIFPHKESKPYVIKGFKNGRPENEKAKRSADDFKKNILPTLGRDEQKHFTKKYKNK